ncbi:T9SS type A sorting domain-containing protein [Flavivirga abyssicola]|uniref:T9SS type A sorting domain-containing protein n=1 Tax=Flavivirga abyssicola TaxID=3063533 RepID=UPI002ED3B90C|nr:T9SS type A sorting domain-containing protein [Flavivirga sp. MEBiC07777]
MKKATCLFAILTLVINIVGAQTQTVFDFDTNAEVNGNDITETINGITLTVSDAGISLFDSGIGFGGVTGNVVLSSGTTTSVTFSFNRGVAINSIIPIDVNGTNTNLTFTPTGGDNSPVTVLLEGGAAPEETVALNWVNVTSFTVSSMGSIQFLFDDLSIYAINDPSVFDFDTNAVDNGNTITETIDGITLTVSDIDISLHDNGSGVGGTTGNVALSSGLTTSVTFSFDQAVTIKSIIPRDGFGTNENLTFTPTGGDNLPKVVPLTGGAAGTVALNWIDVTSFTVSAPGALEFLFDNLSIHRFDDPTVFGWETAVDNGNNVTEIIDGITVTFKNDDSTRAGDTFVTEGLGWKGIFDNILGTGSSTSVTFTFDKTVDIYSVFPLEAAEANINYTFIPTGGNNSPVVVSLVEGVVPGNTVSLSWTGITAFTITSPINTHFRFDNLSVSLSTSLSVEEVNRSEKARVYPNPVENMLHIKNISDLKSIQMYNKLGQLVLESKKQSIDMGNLSKGLYFLQIHTRLGTETKKVIKK